MSGFLFLRYQPKPLPFAKLPGLAFDVRCRRPVCSPNRRRCRNFDFERLHVGGYFASNLGRLGIRSVEGDRDAFARALEAFDAVLEPGGKYEQMAFAR